jgi:DNA-binding CsgD family transcriptional regulator
VGIKSGNRYFHQGVEALIQTWSKSSWMPYRLRVCPLPTTLSVDLLILDGSDGGGGHPCNQLLAIRPYRRIDIVTLSPKEGRHQQKLPVERLCQRNHRFLNVKCTPESLMQVIDQALAQRPAAVGVNCTGCETLLTPREREVVMMLGRGLSNTQVADLLYINIKTVSGHKRTAMRKLGFRRTQELQQWVWHELDYKLKLKWQ